MRKQRNADTIEITEDFRLPGTDVILESGDQVRILQEKGRGYIIVTVDAGFDTWTIFGSMAEGEVTSVADTYGKERIHSVSKGGEYGNLVDYIQAVNTLLSPKVYSIKSDIN